MAVALGLPGSTIDNRQGSQLRLERLQADPQDENPGRANIRFAFVFFTLPRKYARSGQVHAVSLDSNQ